MLHRLDVYLEARNPEMGASGLIGFRAKKTFSGIGSPFAKIGARGTSNYAFDEPEKARKLIKALLRKRLTAQKRIGCNYEIKSCAASLEFSLTNPLKGLF